MATSPYWNEEWMTINNDTPDILAVGDSWFWYLFSNMLNPINNFWNGRYAVLALGGNGQTADELTSGQNRQDLADNISAYRAGIRLIIFSGGGNDITGGSLRQMLQPDCSAALTVADCFRPGQPNHQFTDVAHACNQVIAIRDANGSKATIVAHDYDYAIPDGNDKLVGPRLKGPLDDCRVPVPLRQPLINSLIDGLGATFNGIRMSNPGKFDFVHTAGTLDSGDWGQEAHPTPKGFEKLASKKWRDVLKNYLPVN